MLCGKKTACKASYYYINILVTIREPVQPFSIFLDGCSSLPGISRLHKCTVLSFWSSTLFCCGMGSKQIIVFIKMYFHL